MVDIGIASGTTETSRVTVNEVAGTTTIVGAGVQGGPSRRVDVFEDVWVHGNARTGEMHVVRLRFEQGVDGTITQGTNDEIPRILKLVGDDRLHYIGGGPLFGPGRDHVFWDDVRITNDLNVVNDLNVLNGGLDIGSGNFAVTNVGAVNTVGPLTVGTSVVIDGSADSIDTTGGTLTVDDNLGVTGNVQVDGTLTVGTSSVVIQDSASQTISRNGNVTLDVSTTSNTVTTSIGGVPVITTASTSVNVDTPLEVGSLNNWHRIKAENAVAAAGTWHLFNRGGPDTLNLICGFGWDTSAPGPQGNTTSAFIQHDLNAPPYAGSNVAMLVLEQPIQCAVAVITMWRVDQYDETLSLLVGTPISASVGPLPTPPDNILLPQLMLKGSPPNPGGISPGTSANSCVQQIEVQFYNLAGAEVVPTPAVEAGPTFAHDIVFDIKVCGCECVPVE